MLEVALTQGWPDQAFNNIYNTAITSHPSYVPLYFQKASYMEPKWHGSLDKFNDYVDSVVQETQPILGNQMYARLHWSGSQSNLFRSGRTDWKKMKLGFEELVLNHPDMWNINNFTRFACLAKDIEKLTELLKIINEKPLLVAWRNSIGYYSWCVELVKRNSTNGD